MAGRPSKYSPAYCNEVVECLAEGHSVTGFAGLIGVTRSTIYKWVEDHPDFAEAMKIGQAKAVYFWEKNLISVAQKGVGNAACSIFGVKNRAPEDWADKIQTELTGAVKVNIAGDDSNLL